MKFLALEWLKAANDDLIVLKDFMIYCNKKQEKYL